MSSSFISIPQALELAQRYIKPLAPREIGLSGLSGLAAAAGAKAQVSAPPMDSSRKEGYAVMSGDLAGAGPQTPVRLKVAGLAAAGEAPSVQAGPGAAVRVFTGAALPRRADAVIPEELTRLEGAEVVCLADTAPGRNVLPAGADVTFGQEVARPGDLLSPGKVGLLAAAGHDRLAAHPLPRVGVIATGRELAEPGTELGAGGLYASNLVTLSAWLTRLGMEHHARAVDDDQKAITDLLQEMLPSCDALITTGGMGRSERDLVLDSLEALGWQQVFHGVRMGPGKGSAMGLWGNIPVLCLPGAPPACHSAFIVLVMPALARLAGRRGDWLPLVEARLGEEHRAAREWSRVLHGTLASEGGAPVFYQSKGASRLVAQAQAQALWIAQEGQGPWAKGERALVRSLMI